MNIRKAKELIIESLFLLCALVSILTTIGIIVSLSYETIEFFKDVSIVEFLTNPKWTPLFYTKNFGVLPLVSGTMLVSFIAMLVALPFGVFAAIYISEYASEKAKSFLKPSLEVLSSVPTVVYGYFALLFVTPLLRNFIPISGFNALSSGIVMGFMIIPIVASLSEDAISFVPLSLREASYSLGATKIQTILKVVLPAASSGIISSAILGVSRAIGETMIVAIAAGQRPILTLNPLIPIQTLTGYIAQVAMGDVPHGTVEYRTIYACGVLLFIFTFTANILSYNLKQKFIRGYT